MPITGDEKYGSPRVKRATDEAQNSAEAEWIVFGSDDETAVLDWLETNAAATVDGLDRQSIEATFVDPELLKWDVSISYNNVSVVPSVGQSSFNFEVGTNTEHITQSIQTVNKYFLYGEPEIETGGAINVTPDGVEGADINVPAYSFSETHYFSNNDVDEAFKLAIFNLVAKTNDAIFRGHAIGTVLFMGATGTRRRGETWEVTFRFAANPNRTGITIGDITGIEKKGWELLWVRYVDEVDDAAKVMIKKPIAVFVEQVYYDGDYDGLGIGS